MPLLTLLGQVSLSKTIGGTTQLGSLSSTGGLVVTSTITVGGTDQLEVLTSTGGLDVTSTLTIGGTDQLSAFTATGTIQVGDVVAGQNSGIGYNRSIGFKSTSRSLSAKRTKRKIRFSS